MARPAWSHARKAPCEAELLKLGNSGFSTRNVSDTAFLKDFIPSVTQDIPFKNCDFIGFHVNSVGAEWD